MGSSIAACRLPNLYPYIVSANFFCPEVIVQHSITYFSVVFTQVLLRTLALEVDTIVDKVGERVDMPVSAVHPPELFMSSCFGMCLHYFCTHL